MSCFIHVTHRHVGRLARGVAACHDGALCGLWAGTRTIMCADGTANAVGRAQDEDLLFLGPANGNTGKVGNGSRSSKGGTIHRGAS